MIDFTFINNTITYLQKTNTQESLYLASGLQIVFGNNSSTEVKVKCKYEIIQILPNYTHLFSQSEIEYIYQNINLLEI